MNNGHEQDKQPEITEVEIDVNASLEIPDYLNDPLEDIEKWVKAVYPKDLQEKVMNIIKSAREEQNK